MREGEGCLFLLHKCTEKWKKSWWWCLIIKRWTTEFEESHLSQTTAYSRTRPSWIHYTNFYIDSLVWVRWRHARLSIGTHGWMNKKHYEGMDGWGLGTIANGWKWRISRASEVRRRGTKNSSACSSLAGCNESREVDGQMLWRKREWQVRAETVLESVTAASFHLNPWLCGIGTELLDGSYSRVQSLTFWTVSSIFLKIQTRTKCQNTN